MKTLSDFPDIRSTKWIDDIPCPDRIHEMFNLVYLSGVEKPEIIFIDDNHISKEGFFESIALTEDEQNKIYLKAYGFCEENIFVESLIDRSELLELMLCLDSRIVFKFKAPLPVGFSQNLEITNKFAVIMEPYKYRYHKLKTNSTHTWYVCNKVKPIGNDDFNNRKLFCKTRGNSMYEIENDYDRNECNAKLADLCIQEGFSKRLIADLDVLMTKMYTNANKYISEHVDPLYMHGANSKVENASRFFMIDTWEKFMDILSATTLVDVLPGCDRQIHVILRADTDIGMDVTSSADDDKKYTIELIDGELRPVGPVNWERESTDVIAITFTPVIVEPDYNTAKFAVTRVKPGYPHEVNPYLDGLKEGDVIYGSEVNARRLHPVAPEK